MNDRIIINLPVQDFTRSKSFFVLSNFTLNDELTDEYALCFDIGPTTTVALLPNEHFAEVTQTEITDAKKSHEVLIAVGRDSEAAVDALVGAAVEAGGVELHEPVRTDAMYGRSFSDLDGHQWNIFHKA